MSEYVAPLRRAVLACLGYDAPWNVDTVRLLADVSRRAAVMYLTQLVRRGVLVRQDDDRYVPGPQAQVYRDERPKTKPGGNSRRYRAAQRVRDELAAAEWHARRAALTSGDEQAGQDGGQEDDMAPLTIQDDALRLSEVAERLSVSTWTLRRWIRSGKLKGYILPNGEYRASRAAVEQIFAGGDDDAGQAGE